MNITSGISTGNANSANQPESVGMSAANETHPPPSLGMIAHVADRKENLLGSEARLAN